jgi:hypothetical protein
MELLPTDSPTLVTDQDQFAIASRDTLPMDTAALTVTLGKSLINKTTNNAFKPQPVMEITNTD